MTTHRDPQHSKQQADVYLHCRDCDAVFIEVIELLHHHVHAHEPPEKTAKKDEA